jgi:hypothetical protein
MQKASEKGAGSNNHSPRAEGYTYIGLDSHGTGSFYEDVGNRRLFDI